MESERRTIAKMNHDKAKKVAELGASGAVEVFKIPLEGVPRKKRKVLSEEKFGEALEKIITRDCFPDLEKLKAQNAYLDAVANNDIQMMRELTTKYGVGRNTPLLRSVNDSPATFETPSSIVLGGLDKDRELEEISPAFHPPEKSKVDSDAMSVISTSSTGKRKSHREPQDMKLNEFLDVYTSEDNQSYQDIVDEGIRKHKLKYSWLFNQEDVHKKHMDESLALRSAEDQQSIEYQRPSQVKTWTYKNKNAVMYIPDGVPHTKEELAELAKKKPEVSFKSTRFCGKPFKLDDSGSPMPTPSSTKSFNLIRGLAEGKIGVDGREVNSNITPSVNGFKLVRTPSPNPGVEESPFLTWGEIEGTPFRLDASDTPVPSSVSTPYRIMDTSKRERLALELAEKSRMRYRDRKQKTIEVAKSYLTSPSPRPRTKSSVSSHERINSMSPACRAFARNILKQPEPGSPRTPRP